MFKVRALYNMKEPNPLLGAIPNISLKDKSVFGVSPEIRESERNLPLELKIHLLHRINSVVYPTNNYDSLFYLVNNMIHHSYNSLNPLDATFVRTLNSANLLKIDSGLLRPGRVACISGPSGTGKTLAVRRILSMFPPIICHEEYNKEPFPFMQIPWLYVRFPFDSSIQSVSRYITQKIDWLVDSKLLDIILKGNRGNEYFGDKIPRLLLAHGVALLIVDDAHLIDAVSYEIIIEFLELLSGLNKLGISLLIVGTNISSELETEISKINRDSFSIMRWEPMNRDEEWDRFIDLLFRYQWTKTPVKEWDHLSYSMFNRSSGIIAIAKKIYLLCQYRALTTTRLFDDRLIETVSREDLRM